MFILVVFVINFGNSGRFSKRLAPKSLIVGYVKALYNFLRLLKTNKL
jgi:hypothetical protein